MDMSENFKKLTDDQKRLLVDRVKRLYEAGITAEEISKGLNKDIDLVKEAIEMIDLANKYKEENAK